MLPIIMRIAVGVGVVMALLPTAASAAADTATRPAPWADAQAVARSIDAWLDAAHRAARTQSFAGVVVVSAEGGVLSTARVTHVVAGDRVVERVEMLSGAARVVYRNDQQRVVVDPRQRQVRIEPVAATAVFPDLKQPSPTVADARYALRVLGPARVAGAEVEGWELWPQDAHRFALRVWLSREQGLALRRQVIDAASGRVLEETSFTELSWSPDVHAETLAPPLAPPPEGYRVVRDVAEPTQLASEGWRIEALPVGFVLDRCVRRRFAPWQAAAGEAAGASRSVVQCMVSDGVAAVSLFIEPIDGEQHRQPLVGRVGATQMLARGLVDGAWWVTAVGEVPLRTLEAVVRGLHRRSP